MTIMHVLGVLGCLESGRPVSDRQVREVRRVLDQNHTLRTKVTAEYNITVERLEEILNMKPHLPQRRR